MTVEYALTLLAFASVLVGLGALASTLEGGTLVAHAVAGAPHNVTGAYSGFLVDLVLT